MISNLNHSRCIQNINSKTYENKCILGKSNRRLVPAFYGASKKHTSVVCRSYDFQDHYRNNKSYDVETRNFSYVKETYIDLVNTMLQQCDLSKSEDRQLLAMFISSYFLKVLAFRRDMDEKKILYHKAIGMHFIIETGECETAEEFYLLMDDFIDMVERTKYTD